MKIEITDKIIITPEKGMVITDGGEIFAKIAVIMPLGADTSEFYEITEAEAEIPEEATEADYQDALRELGVEV